MVALNADAMGSLSVASIVEFARCYTQCNSHRTTFVKRFRPEHYSKYEVYKVMKSEGLARSGAQRRFFELHADTCHRQQRQFVSRRFHDYASKHFNHSRILRVLHSSALALCLRPASGGGTLVPTDVYLDELSVTIPN